MQADLYTQDKLKESSCPQVAPIKDKKMLQKWDAAIIPAVFTKQT